MDQARVTILFFGRMADVVGQRRLTSQAGALFALRDDVFADVLASGQVSVDAIRMSVNQVQMFGDQALNDGDEVAFFSRLFWRLR